jgi:hypothetical protein
LFFYDIYINKYLIGTSLERINLLGESMECSMEHKAI